MMHLHNTFTSKKDDLKAPSEGPLKLYVCGVTPYDFAHLGHIRCYVTYDVLVRHLRSSGTEVTYVRNVTDVNDTIIKRAKERREEPLAMAEHFFQAFSEDMGRVGNLKPDLEPRVSETIPEIIALVQKLIDNGHAYESQGDVYFDVPSFKDYGKLSHRNLDDMEAGASGRTDSDEVARKRHPYDFALWKKSDEGELGWDSPWSYGCPGWHIECSAMSMKHLGETLDLHGGGLDLVFPHHENEIAQSEGATGKPYVNHFMHNGFVQVNKEKMSKSLGNFFTARTVFDLVEPEAVRMALLSIHYRAPFNLEWEEGEDGKTTFPTFAEAEKRLEYIYRTRQRLTSIPAQRVGAEAPAPEELSTFEAKLKAALDDDLNTPIAFAVAAEFFNAVNQACDKAFAKKGKIPENWLQLATSGFERLTAELGIAGQDPSAFLNRVRDRKAAALGITGADVEAKIAQRKQARADKDFERADAIRAELLERGVELLDTADGLTNWQLVS